MEPPELERPAAFDAMAGLDRVLKSVPVGAGYAQALVGYSGPEGVFARLEAGYRPFDNLALFAGLEDSSKHGFFADAGVRFTF